MSTLRSSNQANADLLIILLICLVAFAALCFGRFYLESVANHQMMEQMNSAASSYASTHHLQPGDSLPPEKLVADGKVLWWASQDGHVMQLSSSSALFTKGNVPKKGEPYAAIENMFGNSGQ